VYGQFLGGTKDWGVGLLRRKGREEVPLFSAGEKENIDILGKIGKFEALKVPKC
jgi:hypothetical protein